MKFTMIGLVAIVLAVVALAGCAGIRYDPNAPAAAKLTALVAVDVAWHTGKISALDAKLARPILADARQVVAAEGPTRPAVIAALVANALDNAALPLSEIDRSALKQAVATFMAGIVVQEETVEQREAAAVACGFLDGLIDGCDAIVGKEVAAPAAPN